MLSWTWRRTHDNGKPPSGQPRALAGAARGPFRVRSWPPLCAQPLGRHWASLKIPELAPPAQPRGGGAAEAGGGALTCSVHDLVIQVCVACLGSQGGAPIHLQDFWEAAAKHQETKHQRPPGPWLVSDPGTCPLPERAGVFPEVLCGPLVQGLLAGRHGAAGAEAVRQLAAGRGAQVGPELRLGGTGRVSAGLARRPHAPSPAVESHAPAIRAEGTRGEDRCTASMLAAHLLCAAPPH